MYKALVQERADLIKEQQKLFATAEAANRDLTAAEKTRDDEIHARLLEVKGDIERHERHMKWQKESAPVQGGANGGRVSEMHNNEEDAPIESLGEFLQLVANAGMPDGRYVDPRLYKGTASGANTSTPGEAGFLVRQGHSTKLLELAVQAAFLAPLCLPIPVGDGEDGVDMPYVDESSEVEGSEFGGVAAYWRGEADTVAAKMPAFQMHDLRLTELMGLAYASNRALRDATSLEAIFTAAFTSVMSNKLDRAIYRGDGVGKPLGMIDSAGPRVSQAKEGGQTADTIVEKNISNMWMRVATDSKARGFWVYNYETTPQLDALYVPAGTAGLNPRTVTYTPDGKYLIKGRPAYEFKYCSALGDLGDIAFIDPSRYVLISKAMEAAQSMHLRFAYNEHAFRWTYPVNGRPVWKSAKQPAFGNSSVSTFVTLAAR